MSLIAKIPLIIPKILSVLAIILMCVQTHIYGLDNYFPVLDLMVVYFWCIYRPQLMGNGFAFLLGFFKDLLAGTAIGISSLTYLTIRLLIVRKGGNFVPTFYFLWIGFAIILMIAITIKWLLFSFIAGSWLSLGMAVKQFIVSILIYPFVHSLFNKVCSLLPRQFVNA